MNKDIVIHDFDSHFGSSAEGTMYFAPGRINLIGEHTDYNGGFVFPGAVQQGIMAMALIWTTRRDPTRRIFAMCMAWCAR